MIGVFLHCPQYEVAKKVDNAHKDGVWCVAWNKETIFTGSGDGILKTWYLQSTFTAQQFKLPAANQHRHIFFHVHY